ncbi:MAG TPA: recombination mediator RecR [Longimicrobiales bacterium]|nr:recombination mediator RecR [Longimicrobiales bacterium]
MSAIDGLIRELAKLPGVGRKTALRLTYHLLKRPTEDMRTLSAALSEVADRVRPCTRCGNPSETDPCGLCDNPRRDNTLICVVEEASDIGAIEETGQYRGLYHVLGGSLSPLDGIGPEELNFGGLLGRLGNGADVREVIVATDASVEGEATATYLHNLVAGTGVRVTRLARGLPVGGHLEYADGVTIAEAFAARRDID